MALGPGRRRHEDQEVAAHPGAAQAVCGGSLLSDNGTRLEEIAQLVGHSGTAVTEAVYRKQIRPVLQQGAVIMDRIFGESR